MNKTCYEEVAEYPVEVVFLNVVIFLFFFSLTKSSSSTQMNGVVHPLVTQEQYQKNELFWGSSEHIITMNKVSGGDGIPVELFQILKDDAMKVLHSICQQIWKTQQ